MVIVIAILVVNNNYNYSRFMKWNIIKLKGQQLVVNLTFK